MSTEPSATLGTGLAKSTVLLLAFGLLVGTVAGWPALGAARAEGPALTPTAGLVRPPVPSPLAAVPRPAPPGGPGAPGAPEQASPVAGPAGSGAAPSAGDEYWSDDFGLAFGTDGSVSTLAVDAAGAVYAGGSFSRAGSLTVSNVARWTGTTWEALGSGLNSSVSALVTGTFGSVYAAGWFNAAGGVPVNHVARWNGSGWEPLGSGITGTVSALATYEGDTLYAGGQFTMAGGVLADNVARWNGSSWQALGGASQSGNAWVEALAVDPNGNLYAGGYFSSIGGVSANNVAKWTGAAWEPLGSGITGTVYALAADGSGNLYAGGSFGTAGTVYASNVAKWNGSSWETLGSGTSGSVYALAADAAGTVYAGGSFFSAGGSTAYSVARWQGGTWWAMGGGMPYRDVYALASHGNGRVFAGGNFYAADDVNVNSIADWTGMQWQLLPSAGSGNGLSDWVWALTADSQGNVYAGGEFTLAGSVAANHVARWDGSAWSPLGSGTNGPVYALAVDGSGNLYAGGDFTQAGGIPALRVAKWDGSGWSALGSGANATVFALAVDGSGALFAGGYFDWAGGAPANRVAKWSGGAWMPLGGGAGDAVFALAAAGGDLYAGGWFPTAGGATVNHIARWDGSVWSALGSGTDDTVRSLAVDSGGNLYATGFFHTAGGVTVGHVARWNGSRWAALGDGANWSSYALAVDSSDNVYLGGGFDHAGWAFSSYRVAAWNGSDWSGLGGGVYYQSAIALAVSGNDIYVGGGFTTAGGKPSLFIAKWRMPAVTTARIPPGGGTLVSAMDQTTYTFPPGAFTSTVLITHTVLLPPRLPAAKGPAAQYASFPTLTTGIGHFAYAYATYSDTGQPAQPVLPYTLTVGYTAAEAGTVRESSLAVYSRAGGPWAKEEGSTADPLSRVITATPRRLSVWGVLGLVRGTGLGIWPALPDDQSLAAARLAGASYAMLYIRWAELEPSPGADWWGLLDGVVARYASFGLTPVLRLEDVPAWAQDSANPVLVADAKDFRDFVRALILHFGARVSGYVIHNEPNLAGEWSGQQPDAALYVNRLLKPAYQGARQADPTGLVPIVSGALATTGDTPGVSVNDLTYLQGMYDSGARDYLDVLGSNPLGFASAPDDTSNASGFNFSRVSQQRGVMVANGDAAKKVWALEVGWLVTSTNDLGSYNWMKVTEQQQADHLVRALDKAASEWPWLERLFVWNLDYSRIMAPSSHFTWFSLVNANGSPRKAFTALNVRSGLPRVYLPMIMRGYSGG
jgi:hypothetical protein